jgi:uncharacterized membrane protein (DUF106 family)
MTIAKMKSIMGLIDPAVSPSYTIANNPKRKKIAPVAAAMMKKNDFMSMFLFLPMLFVFVLVCVCFVWLMASLCQQPGSKNISNVKPL